MSEDQTALLLADCPENISSRDVAQVFLNVNSRVTAVHIAKEKSKNKSLGYAHVLFESSGAASTALASLGGEGSLVMIGDRGTARISMGRTFVQKSLDEMNLFVKGIDTGVESVELRDFLEMIWTRFAASGDDLEIAEIRLPEDLSTGDNLGYALVSLPIRHQIKTLIQAAKSNVGASRLKLRGRDLDLKIISRSPHGDHKSEALTISVAGLPDYVTEVELRARLRPYGVINALTLMPMKHIAFVKFHQNLQALAALTDLDGAEMRDSTLNVKWARHEVLASGEETSEMSGALIIGDESDKWFEGSLLPRRLPHIDERDTRHGETARGDTRHGETARGDTRHGETASRNTRHEETARGDTRHGETARGDKRHGELAELMSMMNPEHLTSLVHSIEAESLPLDIPLTAPPPPPMP